MVNLNFVCLTYDEDTTLWIGEDVNKLLKIIESNEIIMSDQCSQKIKTTLVNILERQEKKIQKKGKFDSKKHSYKK